MKKRSSLSIVLVTALTLALSLTAGCSTSPQKVEPPSWTPQKVAVLPFMIVSPDRAERGTATSPLTGAVFSAGTEKMAPGAQSTLDNALMDILSKEATFTMVPPAQTEPVFGPMRRERMGSSMSQLVADLGKKFGAQAVLVGHVYRYSELVGGAASASKPASAAFDLAMVRVSDKLVLWKNSFDQTQKPLTEDLLAMEQYMKHGVRWFTVSQYSRIGMTQLMNSFPWLKSVKKKDE